MRGTGDPTFVVAAGVIWMALRMPRGAATLALRQVQGGVVRAAAWGPGAEEALDTVPVLCGADDDASGFEAGHHPVIAAAARAHPGIRIPRAGQGFAQLAGIILEQKVTGRQAFRGWRILVSRYGERAPGPTPRPMFVPPGAEIWCAIPSWAWHRAGVEPPQSRAVVRAAHHGTRLEELLSGSSSGERIDAALTSLPGIGAWTAAETRIRVLGDPDAVPVGDYHLPHAVGYALTGSRADDEGMLSLLEPWRGQRYRVIRLIRAHGPFEPRRGPRVAPEDHRSR